MIVDEYGFDKIEHDEAPQAANVLFKIIDVRYQVLPRSPWPQRRGGLTGAEQRPLRYAVAGPTHQETSLSPALAAIMAPIQNAIDTFL